MLTTNNVAAMSAPPSATAPPRSAVPPSTGTIKASSSQSVPSDGRAEATRAISMIAADRRKRTGEREGGR